MEFKVEIYNENGWQHTIDNSSIWDVAVSSKGVRANFFLSEPQRVTFNMFNDSFMETYMLGTGYANDRDISTFYAEIYKDNIKFLTGYIDLKRIRHDDKTDIVSMMVIELTGLLKVYSDINADYDTVKNGTGFNELMSAFVDGISDAVGYNIASQSYYSIPQKTLSNLIVDTKDVNVGSTSLPLIRIFEGFKEVYSDDLQQDNWYFFKVQINYSYHEDEEEYFESSSVLQVYRIMFPLQYALVEEIEVQRDYDYVSNGDTDINTKLKLYLGDDYSFDDLEDSIGTVLTISDGDLIYNGSLFPTGNTYYFGTPFEQSDRPVWTSYTPITYFSIMKALMLATNNTVSTSATKAIKIKPRKILGTPAIVIDYNDIISSTRLYRGKINTPVEDLNAMSGDIVTFKKELIKYYEGFFDVQTGKTFVIDNISNYIIEPFDTISVNSIEYQVYEIGKDFKRDEYTLKVWRI